MPRYAIIEDKFEDGTPVFVACDIDLPGCMAQGSTEEEAVRELENARVAYLSCGLPRVVDIFWYKDLGGTIRE